MKITIDGDYDDLSLTERVEQIDHARRIAILKIHSPDAMSETDRFDQLTLEGLPSCDPRREFYEDNLFAHTDVDCPDPATCPLTADARRLLED